MKIAPVADVKARFSAYLKASTEGPIIVTRHGKPVAVIRCWPTPPSSGRFWKHPGSRFGKPAAWSTRNFGSRWKQKRHSKVFDWYSLGRVTIGEYIAVNGPVSEVDSELLGELDLVTGGLFRHSISVVAHHYSHNRVPSIRE